MGTEDDDREWIYAEWSEVEETPTPLVITPLRGA